MEIIVNTLDFEIEGRTAIAIGKFDGIHVGHRKLLTEITDAKKDGLLACVFTFDPPASVFFGGGCQGELTTREEKRQIFEQLGVDVLVEFPLNRETAATSPEQFVLEYLHERLHAGLVVAGTDLSFGAGGRGNTALLQVMGKQLDMDVKTIDKVRMEGREVSSTYIRELLLRGDMPMVTRLLGAPYRVCGKIVHGNHIGHTIGFPTANIVVDREKLMPPYGVYFTKAFCNGRVWPAISNVGVKPTVEAGARCGVETHLYGFGEDIYGEELTVELVQFVRPERKFDGLTDLIAQLEKDVPAGESFWKQEKMKKLL